jgi:disulfide bond formation protein DsbB
VLHAVDDAVLHRQPGVPVDQHLPALAVAVVVALAALLGFHRSRPGIRAGIALAVGLLTATNGAMHVIHVWVDGVSGSDLSGILAAVAGGVLVGLGAAIPFLHRGEGALRRTRRWVNRGIAMVTAVVLVVFVLLPVAVGIGQTHKFREPVGAPPAGFRDVSFESTDGLVLAGWYAPSDNGAAVVVVSSAGGDRTRTAEHAALLAAHGYGVLAYDARGSG